MTLRPEPVIALLALVSLGAVLSFARDPRTAPLAIATIAVALAVSAHPVGVVVLAPLAAVAPLAFRTLRASRALAGTIVGLTLAGTSLTIALVFLEADWNHFVADAEIARSGETHRYSIFDEYIRYTGFDEAGAGQPLHRLSLALMFLSFAAVLTRLRSYPSSVSVIPAWSVGIGLASLAVIPSKWPWHFGGLVALTAVAAAAEFEWLARDGHSRFTTIRRVAAIAAVVLIASWSWAAPGYTVTPISFQSVLWRHAFNVETWLIACFVAAAGVAGARLLARRRGEPAGALREGGAWALVAFSGIAIALVIGLHVVDAVRSPWSPARQNVHALTGVSDCGVADHLDRDAIVRRVADSATPTIVHPALGPYVPCARIPTIENGLVETPRVIVTHWFWDFIDGDSPFGAAEDLYGFRPTPGPQPYEGVGVEVVVPEIPGYSRADATVDPEISD